MEAAIIIMVVGIILIVSSILEQHTNHQQRQNKLDN